MCGKYPKVSYVGKEIVAGASVGEEELRVGGEGDEPKVGEQRQRGDHLGLAGQRAAQLQHFAGSSVRTQKNKVARRSPRSFAMEST